MAASKLTGPRTLAIDIGGSHFKASVLDPSGTMVADEVKVETPYPCPPSTFLATVGRLVEGLPARDRASVGFPGMVRAGRVLEVPALSRKRPGGKPFASSVAAWAGFDLATALREQLGVPVRVANDADVQGCAVVAGQGLELVVTLGTGLGTALFYDGTLLPHLELSHAPFHRGRTFDVALGDIRRRKIGNKKWTRLVRQALADFDDTLLYDHVYLGGGNTEHLQVSFGPKVSIVDNTAGITGGVRLWDQPDTLRASTRRRGVAPRAASALPPDALPPDADPAAPGPSIVEQTGPGA
ncbi:MAG: ROK family protein [Actinomycetes bacterium]